jgi:hypothetical protein
MKIVMTLITAMGIGIIVIAVVYFMMMVGWVLAASAILVLIISSIYSIITELFTSSDSDKK